jgi:hypothetical protein
MSANGTYFARVKLRGKDIKHTLETKHLPTTRRKLKDSRRSSTEPILQPGGSR